MSEEDEVSGKESLVISTEFPSKSLLHHLASVVHSPWALTASFFAAFSGIWTLFTIAAGLLVPEWLTSLLTDDRIPTFACLVLASVLTAISWRLAKYLGEPPPNLESLPPEIWSIAHRQRIKWEHRFAKRLLAYRCAPLEREFRLLEQGAVLVPPRRIDSVQEYFDWLRDRGETERRLFEVSRQVFHRRLPLAIASTKDQIAEPREILEAVDEVARLLEAALEHEREFHSIVPPDEAQRLHALYHRRTDEFRKRVYEVFPNLQRIIDADPDADEIAGVLITWEPLKNSDEIIKEMEQLGDAMREEY